MSTKPIIFLAFANDKDDHARYLRNLPAELSGIRQALQEAEKQGLCEIKERANASIADLLDVFQDSRYRDRIAVFHFGGHADGYQLLLETLPMVANLGSGSERLSKSPTGLPSTIDNVGNSLAHGEGLVSFLSKQKGLQLVFFNGCTTERQAKELSDAGIPVVIGTTSEISDEVATNLAIRFYRGIGQGMDISRAWAEAQDEIVMKNGTANMRGLYRKDLKAPLPNKIPWEMYISKEESKNWKLKTPNDMLAEQLLSGLLSLYESGGAEFLKGVGAELAKGLATDTLKKLGGKAIDFFKGKPTEDTVSALKLSVLEKDAEKFKAKSETVLELLKSAVETDEKFAKEVKEIIAGLDEKTQKELAETSGRIVKNIANFTGNNNTVVQGNINSQIHIGNNIDKQFNIKGDYYENKG